MSRAEKKPLAVPGEVTIAISGSRVTVRGPRGNLEMAFPGEVRLTQVEGGISFAQAEKTRQAQMMVGTARSLVANMIEGVISGFSKQLEITGVGFKAARNERFLDLSLGTSHPLRYTIPEGVQVSVADGTKLTVSGIDKQKVGQVAADIYSFSPVEPYKGKGVRIVGKFVRRKEGKKTA